LAVAEPFAKRISLQDTWSVAFAGLCCQALKQPHFRSRGNNFVQPPKATSLGIENQFYNQEIERSSLPQLMRAKGFASA
jgi:hypothetical protein